jgi:hypothetical protein
MGNKVKIYFDKTVLGRHADKQIDFDKSHVAIDLKDADVEWVQYLKGEEQVGESFIVVEGGVIVV